MVCIVEIFFDSKGNILFIPVWKDEFGVGRYSNKFIRMEYGYSIEEIGAKICEVFMISGENAQEDKKQVVHELATGIKSWSNFAKKHELVKAVLNDQGYRISKQIRKKDNSFGLDKNEFDRYTKMLPLGTSYSEIGKTVIEMYKLER